MQASRLSVATNGFFAAATAMLLAACGGSGGGSSAGMTDPGTAPPTASFAGRVTFKGAALAGATVIAFDANNNVTYATSATDATGNYSFSGLNTSCTESCTQTYVIWAFKDGYAFFPVMASNASGSRTSYEWDAAASNWTVANGAAVTRAGFNGQFTNGPGAAGIIFTTFNFSSVTSGPAGPTDSMTGADFVAYDGSNPLVSLAASGQSVSYAAGDDAAARVGVAWPQARFVDNQDGTATDNLTGLVWLKDAGCLRPDLWSQALAAVNALASGACGLSDGSTAGQWRMPNMWELESLIDESAANPAVSAGSPFVNINGVYWTSTSYYGGITGSPIAWAIRMSDGRYVNDGTTNMKQSSALGVWAVKGAGGGAVKLQASGFYVPYVAGDDGSVEAGVPLTFPRMRDNADGTVTDTMTGLIWLKQANCINDTWAGALVDISTLASGRCGLSDGSTAGSWRMPNRKEMESIADRAQTNQSDFFDTSWVSGNSTINSMNAVFSNFIQLQYYWTSTTNASDVTEAWTVFSCDYGVYDTPKVNTGYTLAVR
jgi:hypothetical protein